MHNAQDRAQQGQKAACEQSCSSHLEIPSQDVHATVRITSAQSENLSIQVRASGPWGMAYAGSEVGNLGAALFDHLLPVGNVGGQIPNESTPLCGSAQGSDNG
mmetsp:Transcript_21532/g.55047  ORF Transcript_21532/g.55047 Transcript_21532/m.55047 type:complete len:103 (-) Transcript_21532:568-876(-)